MIPSASQGVVFHYPKHAGPEAKGSNPTAGLTLLWVRNPFRGNFNHCKPHGKPKLYDYTCKNRLLALILLHNNSLQTPPT